MEELEWNYIVAKTNFTQDWAQEANTAKQEQANAELPEKYEHHTYIFNEESAKWFLPLRPEDHAIKLKPGAPSEINCKIYPLTK